MARLTNGLILVCVGELLQLCTSLKTGIFSVKNRFKEVVLFLLFLASITSVSASTCTSGPIHGFKAAGDFIIGIAVIVVSYNVLINMRKDRIIARFQKMLKPPLDQQCFYAEPSCNLFNKDERVVQEEMKVRPKKWLSETTGFSVTL